jgi:hypothetical protein
LGNVLGQSRKAYRQPPNGLSTGNEFSGEVNWVEIELEKDDHDHLISPKERFRIAMARQEEKSGESRVKRNSIER